MKTKSQVSPRPRQFKITAPVALVGLLLGVVCFVVYGMFQQNRTISLNKFADLAKQNHVISVVADENTLSVVLDDGRTVLVNVDPRLDLFQLLDGLGIPATTHNAIDLQIRPQYWNQLFRDMMIGGLPLALVAAMLLTIMRTAGLFAPKQTQPSNSKLANQTYKPFNTAKNTNVTFANVAGIDEVKEELHEVVEFLKSPQKFQALGAKMPKGVLLIGPPGTGKTLLARAIAGEAGVPFILATGSDFVEFYAGVGAGRIRELFEQAARSAPAIVFIDEIDSVGRKRGVNTGNSVDEREQTLNQILAEMDGFKPNLGVMVLAATNREDILDPALMRPGRFDRQIRIDLPDPQERLQILSYHMQDKPVAPDVRLDRITPQLTGFSGADLANMANEAAILAARRDKSAITQLELEDGFERITVGLSKNNPLSAEIRRRTAYHEAGHALALHLLPECSGVEKVSILRRGKSLGYTIASTLEREDKTREEYFASIVAVLSGRAAEQVVFNLVTDSAVKDLEQATKVVRNMVTRFAMIDEMGPVSVAYMNSEKRGQLSDSFTAQIDQAVQHMLMSAYERSTELLTQNRHLLDRIVDALLQNGSLDKMEFEALFTEKFDAPA